MRGAEYALYVCARFWGFVLNEISGSGGTVSLSLLYILHLSAGADNFKGVI